MHKVYLVVPCKLDLDTMLISYYSSYANYRTTSGVPYYNGAGNKLRVWCIRDLKIKLQVIQLFAW